MVRLLLFFVSFSFFSTFLLCSVCMITFFFSFLFFSFLFFSFFISLYKRRLPNRPEGSVTPFFYTCKENKKHARQDIK
ncbi:hypothetical protein BCR41DRAFT_350010 [Lobosporangium transversale]|uniref:Uncharacterized protein n=1 Tax=Lobosporangium transversale TaxID=64571 RepID=A0A1Y2GSM2_9FUNG|nr:hypothetical protein BCR41DRAFT_350010 [Lobosporangium transversale]ORZ21780.1 hypothetical protein BCR41DRAFT_350010 [Lobosporangium transversale]|eukprot:XP_021883031.1 hypothetical protein BCR41DRAFT_350010 [Lobosporangium transversale]